MDWANENYVRLYTRDTKTWLKLRWKGQTLLMHLFRKVDRSGVIENIEDPVDDISLVTGIPTEFVAESLPILMSTGTVEISNNCLVIPNFIEANETPKSDKQRQKECRERRRKKARRKSQNVTEEKHNVTKSHMVSHGVTDGHNLSLYPNLSYPIPDHSIESLRDSHSSSLRSEEIHISNNSLSFDKDPTLSLSPTDTYLPKKKMKKSYSKVFEQFWSNLLGLMKGRNNRLLGCGKWEGKKAWEDAQKIPDWPGEDEVIRIIGEHLDSVEWQRNGGSSVPMLSTWLRAGRWNATMHTGRICADEKLTASEQAYRRSMANIRAFAEGED